MSFYQILQMDPTMIYRLIQESKDIKSKRRFFVGMAVRSVLIVAFAILFIVVLCSFFGSENSALAVVLYCMLLSVRFVDFGYNVKESLVSLAVILVLLVGAPVVAMQCHWVLSFVIHACSFFLILLASANTPEMGNGSLFGFAYVFLCGNVVYGNSLIQRFYMAGVGFLLLGSVFYAKHKEKHESIRFVEHVRNVDLGVHKYQWMLRYALGLSVLLTIGSYFDIPRFMWAGFACSSLLADHKEEPRLKERFFDRLLGVLYGCCVFYVIYTVLPMEYHGLIGPMGGLCLGFCSQYKHKTLLNSLGALLVASSVYGVHQAIFLRVVGTFVGAVFALVFYWLFDVCFAYVEKKVA